ncbi:MAG TPA: heparinase II/III family protein [Armatimonadota bacterium]|nr:heparinase II/III family protein [Armatimonadota bacterium]
MTISLDAGLLLAGALLLSANTAGAHEVRHPVYPAGIAAQPAAVMAAQLERYVQMPPEELRSLVPRQSGVRFCGCPNCAAGAEENNIVWSPQDPDRVRCQFCGHVYPSPDYPATGEVRVENSRGETHVYPYHRSSDGRHFYFEARKWYEQIHYYDGIALKLAQVYDTTHDERFARAAAALVDQYAVVVPGYVPKFDYPFANKRFFGREVKPPYPVEPYRAARYYWWAYGDIPGKLILAYDLIADSPAITDDMRARIERDLFRGSVEWVRQNPELLDNMSPLVWTGMIQAGRVVGEPDYVHDAMARAERLLHERFLYDGFWKEGTPSYHIQTVQLLEQVMAAARGYSDPPGYLWPTDGRRFDALDPDQWFPQFARAQAALQITRLPDGRYAPIHDSWWYDKGEPLAHSQPELLPAAGHAILGTGEGTAQVQAHLQYSTGHGHSHADSLSLLLWARGREMLSDLGYTWTRARVWTTATASHNTLVVDQRNQEYRGVEGNLRLFAAGSLSSVVEAEAAAAYPGSSVYRRLVALVNRPGGLPFVVDIFRVTGGATHDWFLHGSADEEQSLRISVPTEPAESLTRGEAFAWPKGGTDFGLLAKPELLYGFLTNLRCGQTSETWQADFAYPDGAGCRVIVVGAPGTEVFHGRNPSVRQARENEAELNRYTRPFLMVRRQPRDGRSLFVAVYDPALGAKQQALVSQVELVTHDDETALVRVECGDQVYLIATCTRAERALTCNTPEGRVTFAGRYGVMRRSRDEVAAQTAGAGAFSWGERRGKACLAPTDDHGLLEATVVAASPESIEVEYEAFPVERLAGHWAIVHHSDRTSQAYRIARAERVGPRRIKLCVAYSGFEYDAAQDLTRITSYPQREVKGKSWLAVNLMREERFAR